MCSYDEAGRGWSYASPHAKTQDPRDVSKKYFREEKSRWPEQHIPAQQPHAVDYLYIYWNYHPRIVSSTSILDLPDIHCATKLSPASREMLKFHTILLAIVLVFITSTTAKDDVNHVYQCTVTFIDTKKAYVPSSGDLNTSPARYRRLYSHPDFENSD